MARYICTICSYVYDPEKGDPDGGISPGTSFDNLPPEWHCPPCYAPKEQFIKEI